MATVSKLAPDQLSSDAQDHAVGGNSSNNLPPTNWVSMPNGTSSGATNGRVPDHLGGDTQYKPVGDTSFTDLLVWAETLSDLEGVRIAVQNRVRAAEQMNIGVNAASFAELKNRIGTAEAWATKELERSVKRHPLGPWIIAQKGVGLKQAGRLLGVIGDPYIRGPEYDDNGDEIAPSRPRRGPAELWAYCGFHTVPVADHSRGDTQSTYVDGGDIAPKHVRGQQSNWNDAARMRAYLIAESCIKTKDASPLRAVYDNGRAKYADAVHKHPCVRCGPSGKPAPVGSPLSAGHQHARALRLVAKEVLKGLYNESKRLHQLAPDQIVRDTQNATVGGN